jgi:TonB family protein
MPKRLAYDPQTLKRFYPKKERDFGREATVEAMILVDEHGEVVDVHITKSAGASFDAAAKKALLSKLVTVQPGFIGDTPVASWVTIPITFNLTN